MNVCDDTQKIPLPRYLQEHKEEILHIFDKASVSNYNPEAWRNYFRGNPGVSKDLNTIIGKCPTTISRKDVRYFAGKARSGGYEDLRGLFLACMIWGYGPDPNGPNNTKLALSNPRLKSVLEKSVESIKKTRIKEAYEGFNLKGCKSPFFTKFFYFVGERYNIEPLPLILDSHVANFLEALGRQEGWDISIFVQVHNREQDGRISSLNSYSKGYIQYICSMDDWAKKLGCSADNIEYFFYKKDKGETENTGAKGMKEEQGEERTYPRKSTWLPIRKARDFAEKRGYGKDSRFIDYVVEKGDYPTENRRDYARALHKKLFEWRGVWEQFVEEVWRDTRDSNDEENREEACRKYERRAQEVFKKYPGIQDLLRSQ